MATLKQLIDAQNAAAEKIIAVIVAETKEILAQLEAGKAAASEEAMSAAFDEAIGSLGAFSSKISDAVSAMVPGAATPAEPSEPITVATPAPAPAEPVGELIGGEAEVNVVITESASGDVSVEIAK